MFLALQAEKLRHAPHVPQLQESAPRSGFFEEEAFRSVVKHLPESVKPVATFAYHTGWRVQSEILPLTWAQMDFEGSVVRLELGTTKNREGRTFPMFPVLRALLEAQRAYTDKTQRELGFYHPLGVSSGREGDRELSALPANSLQKRGTTWADPPRLPAHSRQEHGQARHP